MNINDILEIEQLKYCYEQAYSLHRHLVSPEMFAREEDTSFAIAFDKVTGWETIHTKFCEDLYYVASQVDSYHTGWQICVPVIWEDEAGQVCGIFPTFGYLVLNMAPDIMKPPYQVLSTQELWYDRFSKKEDRWKISDLTAQFLIGQGVWKWDIAKDDGYAVQLKLQTIPHPFLAEEPFRSVSDCTEGFEEKYRKNENEKHSDLCINKNTNHDALKCSEEDSSEGTGGFQSDGYYGIQFAMSLYTLLWQCCRMDELVDRVFSSEEDISVCYDGQVHRGREEVRRFYAACKEETIRNGGFQRIDMPATQSVVFSEENDQADGRWLTKTSEILSSPEGNQYRVSIGRFSIRFCCEAGTWKIRKVEWEPLQRFVPYEETPDPNLETYRKNPNAWLSGLPKLKKLSTEGLSNGTAESLALRNQLLTWLYQYHEKKDLTESIRCKDAVSIEAMREFQEDCAFLLVTSPVIRMDETLSSAEVFFSVSKLRELGDGCMAHVRGGLYLTLEKDSDDWYVSRFSWYPFATLEPWEKMV